MPKPQDELNPGHRALPENQTTFHTHTQTLPGAVYQVPLRPNQDLNRPWAGCCKLRLHCWEEERAEHSWYFITRETNQIHFQLMNSPAKFCNTEGTTPEHWAKGEAKHPQKTHNKVLCSLHLFCFLAFQGQAEDFGVVLKCLSPCCLLVWKGVEIEKASLWVWGCSKPPQPAAGGCSGKIPLLQSKEHTGGETEIPFSTFVIFFLPHSRGMQLLRGSCCTALLRSTELK